MLVTRKWRNYEITFITSKSALYDGDGWPVICYFAGCWRRHDKTFADDAAG